MKKLIILLLISITTLIIISCDSSDDTITPTPKGNLYVTSNPAGAEIWVGGTNSGKVTPDTVKSLDEGVYSVTLKLTDYSDTTFSISVIENQTSVVGPIVLTSNINSTFFGGVPIRIYESFGTSASEPSGIDLSTGTAYGISSPSSGLVDIYYYSNASGTSFLVQSADNHSGLIRRTDFFVGSSSNIYDSQDSPLRAIGSWTDGMDDTTSTYVFLYDHDGHYSKLRIVAMGGGVPGVPAYLDVQWYYNNTILDNRFQ
jgi:hypothetical protein